MVIIHFVLILTRTYAIETLNIDKVIVLFKYRSTRVESEQHARIAEVPRWPMAIITCYFRLSSVANVLILSKEILSKVKAGC